MIIGRKLLNGAIATGTLFLANAAAKKHEHEEFKRKIEVSRRKSIDETALKAVELMREEKSEGQDEIRRAHSF